MIPIADKLAKQGFLAAEEIGWDQIVKHIDRARQDLKVAEANLAIDSQAAYNYAYLAMLRSGRALMFSFGYRPIDGRQHKTVVEFSDDVLGKDFSTLTKHFDRMRQFRNRFTYDEPGVLVSQAETGNSIKHAKRLVKGIAEYIQKENPQKKLFSD